LSRPAGWKPKRFHEHRLHPLIVTLADSGCRINELLSLRWADCDFDNLLLTVRGKRGQRKESSRVLRAAQRVNNGTVNSVSPIVTRFLASSHGAVIQQIVFFLAERELLAFL
jgi:site-specific recombinase XerD